MTPRLLIASLAVLAACSGTLPRRPEGSRPLPKISPQKPKAEFDEAVRKLDDIKARIERMRERLFEYEWRGPE